MKYMYFFFFCFFLVLSITEVLFLFRSICTEVHSVFKYFRNNNRFCPFEWLLENAHNIYPELICLCSQELESYSQMCIQGDVAALQCSNLQKAVRC